MTEAADASPASVDAVASVRKRAETLRKQAAEKAAAADPAAPATPAESNQPAVTLQQVSLRTDVDDSKINVLPVPEDVRAQIHKQVRLSIAQHANEHPLALTEVMHSGYSRIFLFQVAAPLDTASVVTGDACALGSGDLIAFATEADNAAHPSAQMKVVAARPGHCLMQDTISVSVSDLQDMLNTFNERLEGNMRKLQSCLAAKDGCVRT